MSSPSRSIQSIDFIYPILSSILLLHVRAPLVRLGAHRLALDALGARVVLAGVLADAGGAGVGGDGRLAGTVAFGVAGCIVGAETLLLGLLLLELLAGAGAAAGEGC
jgi:hypothetical protein